MTRKLLNIVGVVCLLCGCRTQQTYQPGVRIQMPATAPRFEIFASDGWQKTGIFANIGDRIGFQADGIAGVRVILQDGSYTVTDEDGRYHFEGVRPGLGICYSITYSSSNCIKYQHNR